MKQACERDEVMQAKRRGESSHVKPSRFTIRHPRFTIYCSIQFQGPVQKKKNALLVTVTSASQNVGSITFRLDML